MYLFWYESRNRLLEEGSKDGSNRRINISSKTGIKAEAKMIGGFFDDDDVGGAPEHQTPIISMYYSSGPKYTVGKIKVNYARKISTKFCIV